MSPERRKGTLSWWALVIVATAMVGVLGYQQRQTHRLAHRANTEALVNHRLLIEFEAFRAERAKQTTETDLKLCQAINTITRRDRATFVASNKGTIGFLRLLGVPESTIAKIAVASKASQAKELARRPLVQCAKLPSADPPKLPKGSP